MKRKHTITARRGEIYRVPRVGKPAAYVRILGVRRGDQPKVRYRRVTKAGGRRSGELEALRWLQWREGAWRLPADWLKVAPESSPRRPRASRRTGSPHHDTA